MEFENLKLDTECDCLNETREDYESLFALKTMKNELRDNDFKSYWEKGRRAEDCNEICSLKGQSVTMVNTDEDLDKTVAIYKQLFTFSPKYKSHITLIKFVKDSGIVKFTPQEFNPLHYDFYKSDSFALDQVSFVNSTSLEDV